MPVIRLGTQGWSYPDWIGSFYAPRAKQEDYLPFYAGVFDTVELDTTFYRPPKATIVRSWARHTPEYFRFTAKVPQRITHEARLASMGEHMAEFVRALEPLGSRLGPLLVQMPAAFERDPGTVGVLDRFLAAAPSTVRLAVEFRHASWNHPETQSVLSARNACWAWTAWRDLPPVEVVTTDFLYLRWIGDRRDIQQFDQVRRDRTAEFDAWEAALRRALPEVREVFGYFNNHWAGHSPASANEMKRRLGLEVTDPKTQWDQQEMW